MFEKSLNRSSCRRELESVFVFSVILNASKSLLQFFSERQLVLPGDTGTSASLSAGAKTAPNAVRRPGIASAVPDGKDQRAMQVSYFICTYNLRLLRSYIKFIYLFYIFICCLFIDPFMALH